MPLFNVYPLINIELVRGSGSYVFDTNHTRYLDLYGGHAVISVGHNHPKYIAALKKQLDEFVYYSNSVHLSIQNKLATLLGKISGYPDFDLFMCNSGAEANENALKLASFYNNRKKVIAFKGAFHGRTHGAVAVTNSKKIKAPINDDSHVLFLDFNDESALEQAFNTHEICAVIIEPIQGVNGIYVASDAFLQKIRSLCNQHNSIFICDEVQCGYGRTGKFFAHQWSGVQPDIITMAKGMGNGYPIGGLLISPKIKAEYGLLGTTFGGAPLACAVAISVLEIINDENLMQHAAEMGNYIKMQLLAIPSIREIRGMGLMLGIEFDFPIKVLRDKLVYDHHILTGNATQANTLRILPQLGINVEDLDIFIRDLKTSISS